MDGLWKKEISRETVDNKRFPRYNKHVIKSTSLAAESRTFQYNSSPKEGKGPVYRSFSFFYIFCETYRFIC